MTDNIHADVVRELGIYAIKATVTLNAGAFGVVLSNAGNLTNVKCVLWFFFIGLMFSGLAIAITYVCAQRASAGHPELGYKAHIALMIIPTTIAFLFFLIGAATAIIWY